MESPQGLRPAFAHVVIVLKSRASSVAFVRGASRCIFSQDDDPPTQDDPGTRTVVVRADRAGAHGAGDRGGGARNASRVGLRIAELQVARRRSSAGRGRHRDRRRSVSIARCVSCALLVRLDSGFHCDIASSTSARGRSSRSSVRSFRPAIPETHAHPKNRRKIL